MKTCSYNNCQYPVFAQKLCKNHQFARTDGKAPKPIAKSSVPLARTLIKKKPYKKKENADELTVWFEERMERFDAVCENCGAYYPHLKNDWYKRLWKSCQAHLLPKRHFKSIATHPLNAMVLGTGYSGMCNCHETYDSSWEKAEKMRIWPEVVRRFKTMYPLIQPEEYKYIPEVLQKHIL